jgi:putative NIF3 family GTP cyclohydrolase 1 type 2
MVRQAAERGVDTLITGEGSHPNYNEAMEFNVNVIYAGHYATETWGVNALGRHLEKRFGLSWEFIDAPTGF